MSTYSFLDSAGAISGPGGSISIGSNSGSSDEGMTIDNIEEKNVMVIGAGGEVMHSLRAGNGAKMTIHLLKTSPTNALLSNMYNLQKASSLTWGKNTITWSDVIRGDVEILTEAAFSKPPANGYSKDGATMTWEFMGNRDMTLGNGSPSLIS